MNILVTGGAGYIGGRVSQLLLEQGHQVTVFDNLSTGFREQVPTGAGFVKGDLKNAQQILRVMPGHDAVMHFAAQAVVPRSVENPHETFKENLLGGHHLIEAMREAGAKKIVYSSTAATYGMPAKLPIDETDPKLPISPYGSTKLALEQLLYSYHRAYNFDVTVFRYFNPYGPGERRQPETHAIPNFIRSILRGQPLPLYWRGEQMRDFFYIDDLAEAHVAGLAAVGYDTFNLGSGEAVKVIDVIDLISELTGRGYEVEDLGERAGDPAALLASIRKAENRLGWRPKTKLREGLAQTIPWYEAELEGERRSRPGEKKGRSQSIHL